MQNKEEKGGTIPVRTTTQNKTGEERTLINFRPVLFCAFFLCGGIAFCRCLQRGASAWWLCLLPLLFLGVLFSRGRDGKRRSLVRCFCLLVSFFFGMGAYGAQVIKHESGGVYGGKYLVCGRIEERVLYNDLCRLTLTNLEIDGNEEDGKLITYLSYIYYEKFALSDCIAIYGKVSRTDAELDDPYYAYTLESDVRYQMNGESVVKLGHEFHLFPTVREKMQDVLFACMDETTASVTLAMLTGDSALMDAGLLENIRCGGIAHIFAVSGLHVGALYGLLLWVFRRNALKRAPKTLRFFLLAALLLFYGGLCGYTASVVRAIVMCLVLYAASLTGLPTDSAENIAIAAIAVLILSPVSLFTAGFQLSFAACFGIAWLARPISELLTSPRPVDENGDVMPLSFAQSCKNAVTSFLSVTLSAQIATAPIQVCAFGYLSGWSLLTNCLFVPIISAVFPAFLLLVFTVCLLPLRVVSVLLYVPNVVWTVLLTVFETFDFSSFAITSFSIRYGGVWLYYLLCTFFTDKWRLSKSVKAVCVSVLITALALTVYASNTPF